MKRKVKALAITVMLLVFSKMEAISENGAKWWGIGTGVATGVVIGGGTFLYCTDCMRVQPGRVKDCFWYHSDGKKMTINYVTPLVSIVTGLGVGALTGYLVYKYLLTQTPRARYLTAKMTIENILFDSLVETQFTTNDEMFKHINVRFGTSWPLVLARSYFEGVSRDLKYAKRLLESAYQEAKKDTKQSSLCKKCKKLQDQIPPIFDLISNRMSIVVDHVDYKFQVKLHEDYLKELRRQEHESREKEKDRWLQYNMHSDKMHQKDKDRQVRENFLNAHQKDAAVNVLVK